MSLDKAVKHGKERRKGFKGSARFDRSCRHGGRCGYCRGNRLFGARLRTIVADDPSSRTDSETGTPDFESGAFDHSAISPDAQLTKADTGSGH